MEIISNLYKQNSNSLIGSDVSWYSELRKNLIKNINIDGMPNKKKEIWKYSNLQHINNIKFNALDHTNENLEKNNISNAYNKIDIINGKYFLSKELEENGQVTVSSLREYINHFKNYFFFDKNYFKKDFTTDLNTIFLSDGIIASVNENQECCLNFSYTNLTDNITGYLRNIIKVGKNSKLVIIEDFSSSNSINNSMNIFNNFWLEQGSRVEHIIIQNFQRSSEMIYSSLAFCYEKSKYNQLSFQSGCNSAKNQHTANLIGKNASTNYNGIYFAKKNQFIENKTTVVHHTENCESNQIYKGVLNDNSTGVYLSNTLVKPEAQKTRGYQLSRGMLLSDSCRLNTKPELKIYADDVKCSHGSTVGAIDKSQLFYLQSRGLNKEVAEGLLIRAFYKDILNIISDDKTIERIEKLVDDWLVQ